MYYIISEKYTGPNWEEHLDSEMAWIQTYPGRTNMSNEERTEGWLGTTNDWSKSAHGEYDTLEEARKALYALYPDGYRELGDDELSQLQWIDGRDDNQMLAAVRAGEYAQLSADSSCDFCWANGADQDVTAATTEEEIEQMVDRAEDFCNDEWRATLNRDAAIRRGREIRDERRDDAE